MGTLNEMEHRVLEDCARVADYYGEEDMFCSDEVTAPGLSRNQVNGYLSQLYQKGYIDTLEPGYYFDMQILRRA